MGGLDNPQSYKVVNTFSVERAAAVLPASTSTAYFTVSGRVVIDQIVGEVTTVFDGTANSIKLIANPTVGADVDICAALVATGDVLGSIYNIDGTFGNAMLVNTSGAAQGQVNNFVVAAGTIDLNATATDTTGATKWTIHWRPLDSGSSIVAA